MKEKFIYCTDEKTANELSKNNNLLINKIINGKMTWVFENNEKVIFTKDINNIKLTNKFYI